MLFGAHVFAMLNNIWNSDKKSEKNILKNRLISLRSNSNVVVNATLTENGKRLLKLNEQNRSPLSD